MLCCLVGLPNLGLPKLGLQKTRPSCLFMLMFVHLWCVVLRLAAISQTMFHPRSPGASGPSPAAAAPAAALVLV